MEAQVQGGGGGRGEVRRVHIIYFLSRKGHIEHPHLVHVHHLSRNGVRLRDVKQWLSELRGKDMPESFAWSYKRKYKAGYVWQDLLDEDLITPISDNEYVLKGSEIASTSFNNEKCSNDEKEVSTQKKSQSPQVEIAKEQKSSSNGKCRKTSESPLDVSTKTSFEIKEESPRFGSETSSLTDDSSKHEKDKVSVTTKQEKENGERDKNKNNSGNAIPLTSNLNDEGDNVNNISSTRFKKTNPPPPPPPSSASNSSIRKSSSSFSGGSSHMFRNWITCGAVDTNESAVMVINRSSASSGVFSNKENSKKNYKGDVGKREKLGGSERILAHSWLLEEHGGSARNSFDERKGSKKSKAYESGEKKAVPAAYKPMNGPNCSQCGRQFRPEKLHSHMKSCRGKKAMAKSSGGAAAAVSPRTNTEKTPLRTTENSFQNSSYYLADK